MTRVVHLEPLEPNSPPPGRPVDVTPDAGRLAPARARSRRPFLPLSTSTNEAPEGAVSEEPPSTEVESEGAVKTETEVDGEHSRLGGVTQLTETLRAQARAEWRQLCEDFAARLSAAAALVLDDLIEANGPDMLAARARAVLRRVRAPEIAIAAAPEEIDTLRAALEDEPPGQVLSISSDSAVAPGQLRLAWRDGGAEVDLAALRHLADRLVRTHPSAPTIEEPR